MALGTNERKIESACKEAFERLARAQQVALQDLLIGSTELPDPCPFIPPPPGSSPTVELCYLNARIDYLIAYLACSGSVNPVACNQDACLAYQDAVGKCSP